MSVDVAAGFSKSLCIECTNGDDIQSLDGWSITQTADPCVNTLTAGTKTAVTLDYSSSTTSEGISPTSGSSAWDPDTFFSNT